MNGASSRPPSKPLIDTHCHLNHERFQDDVPQAIERATAAGVSQLIVVGYDMPSSEEAVRLADQYSVCYAAVAVHPHDSRLYNQASENRLRELAAHPKVVAIGEIGLDYHYDFSPVEAQRKAFLAQLALARDTNLPVIIHCREAYPDLLDILESAEGEGITGVMHCWAGTVEEAERTVRLGFYLGFGGVITFKNADETREALAAIPFKHILIETDAPYLAPVPYRGKRNEPAYVRQVAEKVAEVRGMDFDEVAAATTASATRLFTRLG